MSDWSNSRARQRKFVLEYIKSNFDNATEAAKKAGYSEKTASVQASKFLNNDKFRHVREVIDEIKDELRIKSLELSIADATEILQMLTKILRRTEKEYIVVNIKEKKAYYDENGKRCSLETEEPKVIPIPSKLNDTIRAAELLGRTNGLWKDKTDDSDVFEKLDKVLGKIDSSF